MRAGGSVTGSRPFQRRSRYRWQLQLARTKPAISPGPRYARTLDEIFVSLRTITR